MERKAIRGFAAGVAVVALVGTAIAVWQTGRSGAHAPRPPGTPATSAPAANLEARLDAAQAALDRHDLMAAFTETQAVLGTEPGNPRALTYEAMVRLEMGQTATALRMLDEARAKASDSIAVYSYSAMAYVRLGRMKEAEAFIADAKGRFPTDAAMLDGDFARMKEQAAQEGPLPSANGTDDPHAGVAPVARRAPATDDDDLADVVRTVSGRLEMDPALRAQLPPRVVMFVTLRAAGESKGPVLAAKKIETTGFPVFFEVGPEDSMAGERLPSRVLVEGRVDADGDPATRSPSDPSVRRDDVALGTYDLHLSLRRP